MKKFFKIEDYTNRQPIILSIGNFDGVHKGHRSVLNRMQELASPTRREIGVLTFQNHPSTVLRPQNTTPLLCTVPHKMMLLDEHKVDFLFLLPFTAEFAQQSAADFIENLRRFVPFSHLALGHDATLGKDRQGDRQALGELAKEWNFEVEFINEYRDHDEIVSSTNIRHALLDGDLNKANRLLGRPYSIYGMVQSGMGLGRQLGYPTANIDISGLCCPPHGVYAVSVIKGNQSFQGIANLGRAPTVKFEGDPLLEVHLFSEPLDLYHQLVEIVFHSFIREEKKFGSMESLKQQIQTDIEKAKYLNTDLKDL